MSETLSASPAPPTMTPVLISVEQAGELEAVRRAAIDIVSWILGPNATEMFEAIGKVSGIHGNQILSLAEALGVTAGEWPDDERWITRPPDESWLSTPLPSEKDET